MDERIRKHPDYAEGYGDGFSGTDPLANGSVEYTVGHRNGSKFRAQLMESGFAPDGDEGLTVTFTVPGRASR